MIDTVLFDMGGTLEDIMYDEDSAKTVTRLLIERLRRHGLQVDYETDVFWNRLNRGIMRYRQWSEANELEKKPEEIWPDYYLSELVLVRDHVAQIAEELSHLWEVSYYHRALRPGVIEMLKALKLRGYKLGIISNTISLFQVFHSLERYGVRGYFDDVTLSSITGYRKPHPCIFQIALHQMQSMPQTCVYVGDTLSRDVIGAKRLSFGATVQIRSFLSTEKDINVAAGMKPDCIVAKMIDIVSYLDGIKQP